MDVGLEAGNMENQDQKYRNMEPGLELRKYGELGLEVGIYETKIRNKEIWNQDQQ